MPSIVYPNLPVSHETYRTIKKHATVNLAFNLSSSPIIRSSWSVSAPDASDETWELITELMKLRQTYVTDAINGMYSFGYQGFEQFLDADLKLVLKPLLSESVSIVVDDNGTYMGIQISGLYSTQPIPKDIFIPKESAAFLGLNVEPGYYYGVPPTEICREAYDAYVTTEEGAQRYDLKVAGSNRLIKVPNPSGTGIGPDGAEATNFELAEDLDVALDGGGSAIVANNGLEIPGMPNTAGTNWEIEYVGDPVQRQASFIQRLKALDSALVRSFTLPERTILESSGGGTLAESVEHRNVSLDYMEMQSDYITEQFETQIAKPYIELMISKEEADKVNFIAAPISNSDKIYKQQVALELIKQNPGSIDLNALLEEVSIPVPEVLPEQVIEPIVESITEPIVAEEPAEGAQNDES